jgi:Cu/Ag efflux protein CusF
MAFCAGVEAQTETSIVTDSRFAGRKRGLAVGILVGVALLGATAGAVEYSRDAKMVLPKDYRQWVFLSSGLGMVYASGGAANANPNFENVFVNPEAYQAFVKTGIWPDKTVLILEIRASESQLSINKDGRVQTKLSGIEAHVKDATHGGWAFYGFGDSTQTEGTLLPKSATCYSCHEQNGAVDTTFVQFYPTLAEVAKAHGTFNELAGAGEPKAQDAAPKRFELVGVVQSVDLAKRSVLVQHGNIPGFMAAMTMPYDAGKQEDLKKVSSGDRIHADIVVNGGETHLENITVTGHP